MKRLKSVIFIVIICFLSTSLHAFNLNTIGGSVESASETCQYLYGPYGDAYTTGLTIAEDHDDWIGFAYTPASTQDVCSVEFYVLSINGTITTNHYYLVAFVLNASHQPTSEVATSDVVLGSAISTSNYNTGTFDPPITLTLGNEYGFGLIKDNNDDGVPENDVSNYFTVTFDNGYGNDGINTGRYRWTGAGFPKSVGSSDTTDMLQIKVNTMQ